MIDIQYIRTSMLLLRWGGLNVLTDPWFAMQMRGLPVFVRPCVTPEELPPLDLVLVSHLHPDHFDRRAMARLRHRCRAIVGPPQLRGEVGDMPVDRREFLEDGQRVDVAGLSVTAWSVEHSGYENAYLVRRGRASLLFAGDANYSPVFSAIGRAHPPTVSLLPVGGTLIMGRRIVMGPQDALAAATDLRTRVVVPIHAGGEWMSVPPLSRHPGRPKQLAALAASRGVPFEVAPLEPGQHVQVSEDGEIARDGGPQ